MRGPTAAARGRAWRRRGSARPLGGAAGAGADPGGRRLAVPNALPPPLQGSHRDDAAAGVRDEGPSAPPLDPPRATRIFRDPPQHRSGPPGVPQLRTGLDFPVGMPFGTLLGSLWGSPGPLLFPPRPLFPPSTCPPVLLSVPTPLPHLFWYETPQKNRNLQPAVGLAGAPLWSRPTPGGFEGI
ncbi:hypothetical protein DV515_00016689 [Chloebia gouldiae]|uniref:Uncharacterized protein n=1 Tax=Chloebia gouldiae TaxID=44316 RepID=A0A3L8RS74_CHLGU|nr:hypothetical protein DV515_00016689 [Chloebia gouldiae]